MADDASDIKVTAVDAINTSIEGLEHRVVALTQLALRIADDLKRLSGQINRLS